MASQRITHEAVLEAVRRIIEQHGLDAPSFYQRAAAGGSTARRVHVDAWMDGQPVRAHLTPPVAPSRRRSASLARYARLDP